MTCLNSTAARRFLLWYILIVSVIVLPLTMISSLGCRFVLVQPQSVANSSSSTWSSILDSSSNDDVTSFGFFKTAVFEEELSSDGSGGGSFLGCVAYSQFWTEQTYDRTFLAVRYMAGGLMTLCLLATFICLCLQCCSKSGKSVMWGVMRLSYLVAMLCQGAVYFIFSSQMCTTLEGEPSQCYLGRDGIIGAFNFIFLFGMVVATFQSFPPVHPVFQCWGASDLQDYDDYDDEFVRTGTMDGDEDQVPGDDVEMGGSASDNMSVSLFSGARSVAGIKSILSKKDSYSIDDKKAGDTDEEKSDDEHDGAQNTSSSRGEPAGTVTEDDNQSVSSSRKNVGSMIRMINQKVDQQSGDGMEQDVEAAKEEEEAAIKTVTFDETKNGSKDIKTKTIQSDTDSKTFLRSLAAVTKLDEGGKRVGTFERDHQIELTDKYPANTMSNNDNGKGRKNTPKGVDVVKIRTEYYEGGSRTTKETTHYDGSRTVVTTIESKRSSHYRGPSSVGGGGGGAESVVHEQSKDGTEVSLGQKFPQSSSISRSATGSKEDNGSVRKSSIPMDSLRQTLEKQLSNRLK